MLILTTSRLTDAARQKALESTGKDPGVNVHRLHRDTCPRITPKDDPQPAAEAPARDVWGAKPCSRCSPGKKVLFDTKMEAREALKAERENPQPVAAPAGNVVSLGNLEVHAGPPATRDINGRVKPIRPAAYPEVISGTLHCAGCRVDKPATTFQYVTKKGDGRGRMVECGPCQIERLEHNKANPDAKRRSPKFTLDQVANGV